MEKYSAIKASQRRYNVKFLDGIHTPFGHILSVLVEELKIERPNLTQMVNEINACIAIGGNGFAKIKDFSDKLVYGCHAHYGIARYIRDLGLDEKRTKEINGRINDELMGITPEDRAWERLS